MADFCIFCQKKLSFLSCCELLCGNVEQVVCQDCLKEFSKLTMEERGIAALETGRADQPNLIEAYLKQKREAQEKLKSQLNGHTCLRCGETMLKLGQHRFDLLSGLFQPSWEPYLDLEIERCIQCGKVEFFTPESQIIPQKSLFSDENYVTCSECGNKYHPKHECPYCLARKASFGNFSAKTTEKPKGFKPPWEK